MWIYVSYVDMTLLVIGAGTLCKLVTWLLAVNCWNELNLTLDTRESTSAFWLRLRAITKPLFCVVFVFQFEALECK